MALSINYPSQPILSNFPILWSPTMQSDSCDKPSVSDPVFGKVSFTGAEFESINKKLNDVEHHDISYRSGVGGTKLAYIEGWKLIKIANDIFGFNGWSTHILSMITEFIDAEPGRINAGVSCHVRVTLKDGTFHEDIGFGSAENYKNKVGALEKAKKEAVTDATKRALRYFGYALGLSTYDKEYLSDLGKPSAPGSVMADRLKTPAGNAQNTRAMEMDYSGPGQQQPVVVTGMHYQPNGHNRGPVTNGNAYEQSAHHHNPYNNNQGNTGTFQGNNIDHGRVNQGNVASFQNNMDQSSVNQGNATSFQNNNPQFPTPNAFHYNGSNNSYACNPMQPNNMQQASIPSYQAPPNQYQAQPNNNSFANSSSTNNSFLPPKTPSNRPPAGQNKLF